MTDTEKIINGLKCCSKGDCADCDNCTYHGVQTDVPCESTLMRDALAMLKAQEPGKVNIRITQSDGWKEGNCPFCGMKVDSFYNWSFCGTCGRGLKWE